MAKTQSEDLAHAKRTQRNRANVEDKVKEIVTLADVEAKRPPTTTVADASKIMGITPQFLRYALMQNKFPFGVGVEMGCNEFYINTERFIKYMKAEDMHYK